jgi:hypothetical protein
VITPWDGQAWVTAALKRIDDNKKTGKRISLLCRQADVLRKRIEGDILGEEPEKKNEEPEKQKQKKQNKKNKNQKNKTSKKNTKKKKMVQNTETKGKKEKKAKK